MNIPDFITNDIPKDPLDNNYLKHANLAWKRLSFVANQKTEYIPDDFAAIANTLERFYKGFLKAMMLNTDYKLPVIKHHETDIEYFLKRDHYLKGLVKEIESNFINISPTKTQEQRIEHDKFWGNLQWEYTNARYTTEPSYEDFLKIYKFADNQRTAFYEFNEID